MKKLALHIIVFGLIGNLLSYGQTTTTYGTNAGTLGIHNNYIGNDAGKISTGDYNVFNGSLAGDENTIGHRNVFLGYNAGGKNTTGYQNVFIGTSAGAKSAINYGNVFVGYGSGSNATGGNNTFIGWMSGATNSTARFNTFTGWESGRFNSTGEFNTYTGALAGRLNTTGGSNAFYGTYSGKNNKTGNHNTYFGAFSGEKSDTGGSNTYVGTSAGRNTNTGSDNTFLGKYAGTINTGGLKNTYLGSQSGYNSTGNNNVFIGYQTGFNELGNAKLYIDNSNTPTPLIYGDFASNQLGINTNNIPVDFAMAIKGKLTTEEIKVQTYGGTGWPDFVFSTNYNLPTLFEVEKHINAKGHLKDIPSALEVKENNGILLGEMNAKLLQKIEELTLYTISQEKEILELKKDRIKIEKLENDLEQLKTLVKKFTKTNN